MALHIRDPLQEETEALALLWYTGWYDAHEAIVPNALIEHRTLDSFKQRTAKHLSATRVIGPVNNPLGFSMILNDELYQMYVSEEARGTGTAAALMADCEERFIERGIPLVWLSCTIGNNRAARFYEKCGWKNVATETHQLETLAETFPLKVWRFEKNLVE